MEHLHHQQFLQFPVNTEEIELLQLPMFHHKLSFPLLYYIKLNMSLEVADNYQQNHLSILRMFVPEIEKKINYFFLFIIHPFILLLNLFLGIQKTTEYIIYLLVIDSISL